MPADSFPTPVIGRQLLWCAQCCRTEPITHADLMRHMVRGWPRCCGQVMAYFVEAKHPSPTEDTEERPALR